MTTLKEALDQLAEGHELDNEQKKLIIDKWQKELGIQPCEDAISRQDTLKNIIKHLGIRSEEYLLPAEEAIYKVVKNMPPVTPTQRWIPVSERMPDEFAIVLCNTDSEEIFIATYLGKMNDGTDCFDDHDGMMWEGDVIAWMPLPEPFEPQESEEK